MKKTITTILLLTFSGSLLAQTAYDDNHVQVNLLRVNPDNFPGNPTGLGVEGRYNIDENIFVKGSADFLSKGQLDIQRQDLAVGVVANPDAQLHLHLALLLRHQDIEAGNSKHHSLGKGIATGFHWALDSRYAVHGEIDAVVDGSDVTLGAAAGFVFKVYDQMAVDLGVGISEDFDSELKVGLRYFF